MSILPSTLTTADGRSREVTAHLQSQALRREEITVERLTEVLDNWIIRGVRTEANGRQSRAYWGRVEFEGVERLMRVAVSLDERRLTTAHLDSMATKKWISGDFAYFRRNYSDWEVRDEAGFEL